MACCCAGLVWVAFQPPAQSHALLTTSKTLPVPWPLSGQAAAYDELPACPHAQAEPEQAPGGASEAPSELGSTDEACMLPALPVRTLLFRCTLPATPSLPPPMACNTWLPCSFIQGAQSAQ